ncbi:MAG: type II toxin-antitoxin system VapC family toxin [Candidatus Bathyarchaeia archaeon]
MKVIDSSTLIRCIAKEEGWEDIEMHLREGCTTLDLALKEVANALVKKILRNEVDIETARKILGQMPRIVKVTSQAEHFPKALEIAAKNKLTIYDALFIALASNTNAPLLTSDRKQAKSKEYGITTILI